MSTKQMVRAAYDGRRLTVSTTVGQVMGYLVGMDDYHWLVAEVADGDGVDLSLIHKSMAPRIRISRTPQLATESDAVQAAVAKAGGAFFRWCGEYLSRPAEAPSQH